MLKGQSETKYALRFNFQQGCIDEMSGIKQFIPKKCMSNCLFIQIVLALVAIKYIEFKK